MSARVVIFVFLLLAAAGSGWLLNRTIQYDRGSADPSINDPDYFMDDFDVTAMDDNGLPAYRLYAIYMEHWEAEDTSELYEPVLEIYRENKQPINIAADRGWLTEHNEVVLLRGKVRMWTNNQDGETTFNVDTSEVRVLIVEEYAETDQYAVIVNGKTTVTGYGVRANFAENMLEILNHEKTTVL